MALTILRMHEAEIAKIDDPLEVFQVVQVRIDLSRHDAYFGCQPNGSLTAVFFLFLSLFVRSDCLSLEHPKEIDRLPQTHGGMFQKDGIVRFNDQGY